MLIQIHKSMCFLCFTTLFFGALFFPSTAMAVSELEHISEYAGVDASASSAIAEIRRIYHGYFGVTPDGESLNGYYSAHRFTSEFFPNHDFYDFFVSWSLENPDQMDYIAVNRKTLTPYLLMGDPAGWDKKAEKIPNISSNSHYARDLNLDNLNTIILNENIAIIDGNLTAYIKELFLIIGIRRTDGDVYFDRTSLYSYKWPNSEIYKDDVLSATEEVEQFFLARGNSMYVSPLDNGAFHIIVLNWLYTTGEIVEWDFTVNANGTIDLHDIRDVARAIGTEWRDLK